MTVALGYANRIDEAAVTGGSWEPLYPLSNIKSMYSSHKARSIGKTAVMNIAFSSPQKIEIIAICNHNLIDGKATITLEGFSDTGASVFRKSYPSGTGNVFFETFSCGMTKSWQITIGSTGTDAYVDVARVFIGSLFNPRAGADWQPSFGIDSFTNSKASMGGVEYFDERKNRRTWRGKWSWLNDSEAYLLYEIMRNTDISREVFFSEEIEDYTYRHIRSFRARFRQLTDLEYPYLLQHAVAVEVAEIL